MGFQELALLLLLLLPLCSAQSTYYVTPTPNTPCPGQPCYSLSDYISGEAGLLDSNDLTFLFLPGNHSLDSSGPVNIAQSASLNLFGNITSSPNITSMIICSQNTSFFFSQINQLNISGIAFKSCGSVYDPPMMLEQILQAEISNCFFQEGQNGALAVVDSTLTLQESRFENNSANSTRGGGVFMKNCTANVSGNVFVNNSASEGGGGVYMENSIVSFDSNCFENNTANHGGGIQVNTNSSVSATNNTFTRNSAGLTGGGIWVEGSFVNITKSEMTGNSAGSRGGGSYIESGTVVFHGNMFLNNSATFNGAGIYIASGTNSTECTNNTFSNNVGGGWVLFIEDSRKTSALLSQNAYDNNTGNVVYVSSENSSSIYHITPSLDIPCPSEPCLTISEFIDQAGQYVALNTTLMFLPGTHTVRSGLLVENIASLTLLGDSSEESLPLIKCDRPASLGFKYIDELVVHSLAFDSCGDGTYAVLNIKLVSSVGISNCYFNNSISSGGAVVVTNCNTLLIAKTVFENNSAIVGGGLYVSVGIINFTRNEFTNNKAELGGAAATLLDCSANFTGMTTFTNNSVSDNGGEIVYIDREFREGFLTSEDAVRFAGGAMFISSSSVSFHGNTTVYNNNALYGGGMCVLRSSIFFTGPTYFINNSALLNGGGLLLAYSSLFYVSATTLLNFTQNLARLNGGAIYVDDTRPSVYCDENTVSEDYCFFQVQTDNQLYFLSDIMAGISFSDNTADEGGDDLYGGTVDNCKLMNITVNQDSRDIKSSGDVFDTITIGKLDITSVPLQVCSCERQTPDCSQVSSSIQMYPGRRFNVPVAVRGQRNGAVSAVIQTQTSDNIKLQEFQAIQKTNKSQLCSNLSFRVFSSEESQNGSIILYINAPCLRSQNSLTIQVQIQSCPHGFQLNTSQNVDACHCDPALVQEHFTETCDVETGTIFRSSGSTFWVGYDNGSDSLILHPQCPFDYCTEVEQYVNVDDSDTQCNHRTGKLCGKCIFGYSLAFGSSRCILCSPIYGIILWMITFAVAGIVLVVFLFVLKLTMAGGTINGLIFYANIVQVNSLIFYKSVNINFKLLSVFISWLNLDFGIEICFYYGMDVYTKTWLQFVFPVYVWLLVGIIIFISHYSRKITKLLGSNPIAVLATLFLLSYTKILRTIIAALSVTYLQYTNRKNVAVWTYDGNIEYLSGKHTPLFITALLSLILLFLPFTLLLFLGQWLQMLQAKTEWRILSWINKPTFRAFLDAYHAPYTCSHRYWTGLLLLVRCILLIIPATIGNTSANLLAVSSAVIGLITFALATTGIYRNRYFGILEASFFLNLALLTIATSHVQATGSNQTAVTLTSLSIAFITFVGIVTYHIFLQIRGTKMRERVASQVKIYVNRLSIRMKRGEFQLVGKEENIAGDEASITTSFVELREPLLDDN